jgi:hypothetical protein
MKKFPPILFSLPVIDRLQLPPRAEILPRIESGELDHLDFVARVFNTAPNTNHYAFPPAALGSFASSFEGQPFLRNHDTYDIASRDGTILESGLSDKTFIQTIRLSTRRGMTDFVEGKIDRFSIGWFYKEILCSICGTSIYACSHAPGREYAGKACELIFTEPRGKETSAVNAAAVQGTGIDALLQYVDSCNSCNSMQIPEITGESPAVINVLSNPAQASARRKDNIMSDPVTSGQTPATTDPALAQLEANRQAAAELLGETQRQAALDAQLEASNQVLVAQCAHLLESGLSASRLPEVVQNRIRKTFEGKAFKAAELTAAIAEARDEVAALTAGQTVRGPGRITGVWSGADQLTLAVEDLLGVQRTPANKDARVARLSGIREAYILLTGDRDFVGGSFPEFALGDTSTFPVIVKNALNKRLENAWAKYGAAGYDWWQKVVSVEHFETLQQIDWLITGTIGSLPTVAEKGEYQELPIGDNGETSDWTKYGGYIGLTLEAILRDDVRAFKRLPDELAMGGIRNISAQVAAIFTANAGVGPTLSDTGALFNNTVQTTKGGHKNLLTTALGTDLVAWRAVEAAMYQQPMHVQNAAGMYGTGKNQAVKPKYCLVPMNLKGAADDLFLKNWNASGPNMVYGFVEPVVVPDWTDATDWAAVADPAILPGIMLGEIFGVMPQVVLAGNESDPAMFSNDESRLKVRQFLTVGIANWRALSKNNVAG